MGTGYLDHTFFIDCDHLSVKGKSKELTANIEDARGLAALIGAKYVIEETTEMADPNFIQNTKSRCYYCKTHLFHKA
jgi:PP-loop superfamily ATP-utilizing enzyme